MSLLGLLRSIFIHDVSKNTLLQIGIDPLTNVMDYVGLQSYSQFKSIHSNFEIATIGARNKLIQSFVHAANQINAQQRASKHIVEMKYVYQEMIRNGLFYDVIKLDLFGMFARLFRRINGTETGLLNMKQLEEAFKITRDDVRFTRMNVDCLELRLLRLLSLVGRRILSHYSEKDAIVNHYFPPWLIFYQYLWQLLEITGAPLPNLDSLSKGFKPLQRKVNYLKNVTMHHNLVVLYPQMLSANANDTLVTYEKFEKNLKAVKIVFVDTIRSIKRHLKQISRRHYTKFLLWHLLLHDAKICVTNEHMQRLYVDKRELFDWFITMITGVLLYEKALVHFNDYLALLKRRHALWILDKYHYLDQNWLSDVDVNGFNHVRDRLGLLVKYYGTNDASNQPAEKDTELFLSSINAWVINPNSFDGESVELLLRQTDNEIFLESVIKTMGNLRLVEKQYDYLTYAEIALEMIRHEKQEMIGLWL